MGDAFSDASVSNYDKLKDDCLKILKSNVPPTPEGDSHRPEEVKIEEEAKYEEVRKESEY